MKLGTRSLLYGAHCFFVHPWFVAAAWYKLYRWRSVADPHVGQVSLLSPALWIAFVVHDWGYWGSKKMDDDQGELHPFVGAGIVSALFDQDGYDRELEKLTGYRLGPWGRFTLYHSRFLAKRYGQPYSMLCVADKLAVTLEPWWLYLPRVEATGEIKEYMGLAASAGNDQSKYKGEPVVETKYSSMKLSTVTPRQWFETMCNYLRAWVNEHKDGKQDSWTPG